VAVNWSAIRAAQRAAKRSIERAAEERVRAAEAKLRSHMAESRLLPFEEVLDRAPRHEVVTQVMPCPLDGRKEGRHRVLLALQDDRFATLGVVWTFTYPDFVEVWVGVDEYRDAPGRWLASDPNGWGAKFCPLGGVFLGRKLAVAWLMTGYGLVSSCDVKLAPIL